MSKVKVPWLCSRSQPGIKVIIRDLRGHLLHTVTFLVICYYSWTTPISDIWFGLENVARIATFTRPKHISELRRCPSIIKDKNK